MPNIVEDGGGRVLRRALEFEDERKKWCPKNGEEAGGGISHEGRCEQEIFDWTIRMYCCC